MYIRRIEINNIRSIEHFEMTFAEGQEAGWHVLIGDNGAGKSTIVRSVALAMLDITDINAAGQNWDDWLNRKHDLGSIDVQIAPDGRYETQTGLVQNRITFEWEQYGKEESRATLLEVIFRGRKSYSKTSYATPTITTTSAPPPTPSAPSEHLRVDAWFSAAYGPFRRFTGGSLEKDKLYQTNPRLGAHLSAFGEDVALSGALAYLQELYVRQLEDRFNDRPANPALDHLKTFINEAGLLPHQTKLENISVKDGVYFKDGNGSIVRDVQMSDGYRSVLSMMFELIRQLIRVYGADVVFQQISRNNLVIDLPGVVLVDEIDAHLHPTWQTRIGQWFTRYFPNLQFIVTTHSPLVCRAAEKGSIWRLAAPGSNQLSGEVTGIERDRLIYGNVLDAYGTEVFGENVSQSNEGQELAERLAKLNVKSFKGVLTDKERQELYELKAKLPTAR